MKRFVVVSDIHGYFKEFMLALDNIKFNPITDTLISLGDSCDRGPNPREVIEFLNDLPNKHLIWGNHSHLMQEAIKRRYFESYDVSNGTANTAYDFCKKPNARLMNYAQILGELRDDPSYQKYINSLINYYESQHFIFCHGFLPCNSNEKRPWYINGTTYTKRDDWRNATDKEWYDAMWINGMKACMVDGIYEENKTIVFGHYHTSWGHHFLDNKGSEFGADADFSPYYGDGIIAIDGCTAYSGKVNILVIEDI